MCKWSRECPECGKILTYSCKRYRDRANDSGSACMSCSKKGQSPFKGRNHTDETKKKISDAKKGNTYFLGHKHSEESIKKMSAVQSGKIITTEWRRNLSLANGGNGKCDGRPQVPRQGAKKWARDIKKRDGCCQYCGSTKRLHAHHIFSVKKHPEMMLILNNGITLCKSCHIEEHRLNGVL